MANESKDTNEKAPEAPKAPEASEPKAQSASASVAEHFSSDAYAEKLHETVEPNESPLDQNGFVGVSPEYQGGSEVRAVGPNPD